MDGKNNAKGTRREVWSAHQPHIRRTIRTGTYVYEYLSRFITGEIVILRSMHDGGVCFELWTALSV